jgi:hypothetical protein
MAFKRNFRREAPVTSVACSCGSQAKLSSRKNYPFGKKSKGITSKFFKCKSCKNISFLDKVAGGIK